VIDLDQLAEERSQTTKVELSEWKICFQDPALERVFSELTDGEIRKLVLAAYSPEVIKNFASLVDRFDLENPSQRGFDKVAELMDESGFSLSDWLEALSIFQNWLIHSQQTSAVSEIFSYIHCCAVSPEGKSGATSLSHLVGSALSEHGMERAKST